MNANRYGVLKKEHRPKLCRVRDVVIDSSVVCVMDTP